MENLIDPAILPHLLDLSDGQVIVPLKVERKDVTKIKGLKFTDAEIETVDAFQLFLFHRGFIKANTFADMVVYLFNLGYTLHKKVVDAEVEREAHR